MELFKENQNGALLSNCRKYRYVLWRIWDETKPMIMFIGLNPSKANETSDDPTIRRVKKFAADWGFGGVYMLNLFTYITTNPNELMTCIDPVGPADYYIISYQLRCEEVVFCWGAFEQARKRADEVIIMLPQAKALIINKDGTPRHPLYVKSETQPIPFNVL